MIVLGEGKHSEETLHLRCLHNFLDDMCSPPTPIRPTLRTNTLTCLILRKAPCPGVSQIRLIRIIVKKGPIRIWWTNDLSSLCGAVILSYLIHSQDSWIVRHYVLAVKDKQFILEIITNVVYSNLDIIRILSFVIPNFFNKNITCFWLNFLIIYK